MRILRLQVEGFKRIIAVDITPEGDLIEVRGDNGNGKSSVLDAIFTALAGASHAPVKPIREGEEFAIIRVDLGELVVTRIFTPEGTTRLKVTNADGTATFDRGQTMLDELVGHIAFDPLEFARLKPDEQADQLKRLVTIDVDLDALAKIRKENFDQRRDINRDAKALKVRLDAIPKVDKPETLPDRAALVDELGAAADKNAARQKEIERRGSVIVDINNHAIAIADLERRLAEIQGEIEDRKKVVSDLEKNKAAWQELPEIISTDDIREKIAQADKVKQIVDQIRMRDDLEKEYHETVKNSDDLTTAIEASDKKRNEAIAAAEMPVEGLSLVVDEDGKLGVTFDGIPFSQASSAEQLRVSTAIAMKANPKLRVIRIKDGSLLDKNSLAVLRSMATENDFQIWGEFVGDEGSGVIMEAGKVRGAPDPEPLERPKRRKVAAEENASGLPKEAAEVKSITENEPVVMERQSAGQVAEAFDAETGEIASKAEPEINKPSTLFERMSDVQKETESPRRRRTMTEFRSAPLNREAE